MGLEEQQEEREVLESIFPGEITDMDESSYRISMLLDVPNPSHQPAEDSDDDEEFSSAPTLLLNVKTPPNYPDVPPVLDITQPPNAPKHPDLDIQEDKAELLKGLEETIEENLGMAMIFSIYSALKENAEALILSRQAAVAEEHEQAARQAEAEENRKFEGEKVTRETFLQWSEGFKKEIEEAKAKRAVEIEAEEKKKKGKTEERKLTGKQLWEQGLAGKAMDEEEDDGEDAIAERLRDVKVEG